MRAYIQAIRRAKRFIYIENQYFMGSAYGWLDDQDVHCYNVIPMEITQQICEAISAGRRFTVIILIFNLKLQISSWKRKLKLIKELFLN